MTEREIYYRYEDYVTSPGADEFGDALTRYAGECVSIRCREFTVLRHTPKGVWLATHRGDKFVAHDWTKRYALPTKEEALRSFIQRKRRQIAIYQHRLADAQSALTKALKQ